MEKHYTESKTKHFVIDKWKKAERLIKEKERLARKLEKRAKERKNVGN